MHWVGTYCRLNCDAGKPGSCDEAQVVDHLVAYPAESSSDAELRFYFPRNHHLVPNWTHRNHKYGMDNRRTYAMSGLKAWSTDLCGLVTLTNDLQRATTTRQSRRLAKHLFWRKLRRLRTGLEGLVIPLWRIRTAEVHLHSMID